MSLKSSTKTATNTYELVIEVSGEKNIYLILVT